MSIETGILWRNKALLSFVASCACIFALIGCSGYGSQPVATSSSAETTPPLDASASTTLQEPIETSSIPIQEEKKDTGNDTGAQDAAASVSPQERPTQIEDEALDAIPESTSFVAPTIFEDYRSGFVHGTKIVEHQKYIVLHDTEGSDDPWSVINWWDSNGNLVAAHFVVDKDGTIVQCVPLDAIAHHAGFGDAGHNILYGVEDESRDDKLGTVPIGDWAPDYGMNSYSIGIEMVHISGEGFYPKEQLDAVDNLIAYIDNYYGFESQIIDHKAWRTGNSDTSPEFSEYLANYQDHRTHG